MRTCLCLFYCKGVRQWYGRRNKDLGLSLYRRKIFGTYFGIKGIDKMHGLYICVEERKEWMKGLIELLESLKDYTTINVHQMSE